MNTIDQDSQFPHHLGRHGEKTSFEFLCMRISISSCRCTSFHKAVILYSLLKYIFGTEYSIVHDLTDKLFICIGSLLLMLLIS